MARFKLRRSAPLEFLIYVSARLAMATINILDWYRARRLGRWLGRLLYFLDSRHRKIAIENIERSGVAQGAEAEELAYRMYENLGILGTEVALTARLAQSDRLRTLFEVHHPERVEEALTRGRGVLAVAAHMGNWETGGVAYVKYYHPLHFVARPLDNRRLDAYVEGLRMKTGARMIAKDNATRAMTETLKRNGIVGMVVDQDARHTGVFVPFFGRPASTVKSPAVLSLRYGTPILPLNFYREGNRLHLEMDPPIYPEEVDDESDRVTALTARFSKRLEDFIRRHPDQWWWLHRRWKTQPSAASVKAT